MCSCVFCCQGNTNRFYCFSVDCWILGFSAFLTGRQFTKSIWSRFSCCHLSHHLYYGSVMLALDLILLWNHIEWLYQSYVDFVTRFKSNGSKIMSQFLILSFAYAQCIISFPWSSFVLLMHDAELIYQTQYWM